MAAVTIRGIVASGLGQGAGFTRLDWVREASLGLVGIDPYPGTLNLQLRSTQDLWSWARVRGGPHLTLEPPSEEFCRASLYPVRVAGRFPAVVVLPRVAGYAPDRVELVAAVGLRTALGLQDGDRLVVEWRAVPPLQAVIFDVDGTLVDSVDAYRLAAERAAAPYGYPVTAEAVREALNGNASFWDLVLAGHADHSPETVARLRAETLSHWPEILARHVHAFPGVDETLGRLHGAGLRLGIYTGSSGESFAALERTGLMELFDVVVTAKDVANRKPHPEGILRCLEQLDLPPSAAAYVGDTPLDVGAARAAGVLAIGLLSGAADSALLAAAGADRLLPGHAALPELLLRDAATTDRT